MTTVLPAPPAFLWGAAAGFVLGAGIVSAVAAALESHRRRTSHRVLGFALTALVDSLQYLREMAPTGPLDDQARRCHELAAAVARLAQE